MNILITGGTGLIGRALIDKLLIDDHKIFLLTRNIDKAKAEFSDEVFVFPWDGTSPNGWAHIIEEVDAVINLAGESIAGDSLPAIIARRWTSDQKKRIEKSRIESGKALTKAIQIASKKPGVFIQASAVGYYGPQGNNPVSENTPAGKDYLSEVCQSWEASTANLEKIGVRRVTIRTGLVLSSQGGILPLMLLPYRLFVGGPIGTGDQYISWIHMRDQVGAIRFLLTKESAYGAYNLTAPNPINYAEFGRVAGQILNRPNFIRVPSFALKLALGEKATLVLDGQRAIPQKLIEEGYEFEYKTLDAALRALL